MPSRAVDFGPYYRTSVAEAGIRRGSQASRALGRTICELADAETLPGPDDAQGLAPVPGDVASWGHARRVPRTGGLWVWYTADSAVLTILAIARV